MAKNWRISSFSGALLAAYFIPVWGMVAYGIMFAPVHALYEQSNISAALYISDHLNVAGINLVRLAWMLALSRITVVAFFAIFLTLWCVPATRRSGAYDEALGVALGIGSLICFTNMVMASLVGETGALRLHATELLLLLGTAIVLVVQRPVEPERETLAGIAFRRAELLNNR